MTQDLAQPGEEARAAIAAASRSAQEPPQPSSPSESTVTQPQALQPYSEAAAAAAQGGGPASPQLRRQQEAPPPPSTESTTTATSSKWYSLEGLRELTRGVIFKSGPPTPTRALSAAHSSQSDSKDTPGRTSNDGAEASGTQTPRNSTGAQAPAPKGRLTIKIAEARGLRKSRDPYVVAVFQRSELISGGPRPAGEEENLAAPPPVMGGIPIQRSGSDSGRPMAIPMRSRQSSNTSITDYNTFRNRTARAPILNPKWDAEAVLYGFRNRMGMGEHGLTLRVAMSWIQTCWSISLYTTTQPRAKNFWVTSTFKPRETMTAP